MQYQKIFFVAVVITGILLLVFLGQLSQANTTMGAGVEDEGLASVPTIRPPAATPRVSPATPTLVAAVLPPTSAPTTVSNGLTSAGLSAITAVEAAAAVVEEAEIRFHTVQAGETLVQIAEQYGAGLPAIIARNELPPTGAINAGQLLMIPIKRPTPEPPGITLNGLPQERFIVLSTVVEEHELAIYERGQALGRNAHAFSVIGDSTVEMFNFLTGFETVAYDLGNFSYLEPVLFHYAGSFSRPRMAVESGIHSRQVFLDYYADPAYCEEGESMIDCEWRLASPSVVLIRMGSNDGKPELYATEMRRIVDYALERGVIPIIGTKADDFLDPGYTNNATLRQIAAEYRLPLWDFQLVAQTLPDKGLLYDRVHLTLFPEFDWTLGEAYRTGHGLQNLTALMALAAVLDIVSEDSAR